MGAKNDLARQLADEYSLPRNMATAFINSLIAGITDELKKGHKVTLEGLGSFWPKVVEPHKRFSHITKQEHDIPTTRKVSFRPSGDLRRL